MFLFFVSVAMTSLSYAQDLNFQSINREDGTAFFSMNSTSGQVYYMLDYGTGAGTWKSYGKTIVNEKASKLTFSAIQRTDGTAFFALNTSNGQLYYMLDYGTNAGNWKSYGGTIAASGIYTFSSINRADGTAFFAMEGKTGQVYYMLDYGSDPGIWNSYGGMVSK